MGVGKVHRSTAKRNTAKCLSQKLPAMPELDASVPIFQERAHLGVFLPPNLRFSGWGIVEEAGLWLTESGQIKLSH